MILLGVIIILLLALILMSALIVSGRISEMERQAEDAQAAREREA